MHLEDLANDIEKFHVLVQQLTAHKAALSIKVEDNTAQLQTKEEELEKKEAKLNQLRHVIEHQEFSMEDIHKLENEKGNVEEKIRQTTKVKEVNETTTLNKAMDLSKLFDDAHSIVEDFNSRIEVLFPKDEASSHMISIQKSAAHEQDQSLLLGGVDLKGMIVPSWTNKKHAYTEKISQLRRDVFDLTDQKEASEEAVSEINSEIEVSTRNSQLKFDNINMLFT